jgi:nucleotide-binding universal stress UspA family protein
MAKRILVPLKAVEPARSFLETLTGLARGTGATVRLLHVGPLHDSIVDDDGRLVAYADQETRRLEAEARDFMEVVAIALDGVPVEIAVRFGDPAAEILDEADLFGADLIALPITRRRRFLVLEGVAGQLLRRATAPVALLSAGHPEVATHP